MYVRVSIHTHTHAQFIYFTLCMSVLPMCTHVHHSQVHTEVMALGSPELELQWL